MKQDLYQAPDYFKLDELLTEEHKLIRDAAREWIKKEVSPIIETVCQTCKFPKQILPKLGELGGGARRKGYKPAVAGQKK